MDKRIIALLRDQEAGSKTGEFAASLKQLSDDKKSSVNKPLSD